MDTTAKPPGPPEFITLIDISPPFPEQVTFHCPACGVLVKAKTPAPYGEGSSSGACRGCKTVYSLFRNQTTYVEVHCYDEDNPPPGRKPRAAVEPSKP